MTQGGGQGPCVIKRPTENGYWANIEMGSALCPYITGQSKENYKGEKWIRAKYLPCIIQ